MGRIIMVPRRGVAGPQLASFVFNGSDEWLERTFLTSGANTTMATISMWIKRTSTDGVYFSAVATGIVVDFASFGGDTEFVESNSESWGEAVSGVVPADSTWEHWVVRYDSTQGTADNRIRFYRNGSLQTDVNVFSQPGLNESNFLFVNDTDQRIGSLPAGFGAFGGKMAFIDILEGVSAAPTDFAFDDGGTWTRMPYAGSYGTYGFSLDGSDGFNDVSGNGQHFTGVNMDASNLDTVDLPPYTT